MDADFLLLRRMRQGDEMAIEEFVRKYYPLVLRYCRLHLWDTGEAEDVTQEVFARFFRTLPQYQHSGKAANYLYVIAGNLCRDSFKKIRPLPLEEVPEEVRQTMYTKGNPDEVTQKFLDYIMSDEYGTKMESLGYGVSSKMQVKEH